MRLFQAFPAAVRRIVCVSGVIRALSAKLSWPARRQERLASEGAMKSPLSVFRPIVDEWKIDRMWGEAENYLRLFDDRFVNA